MYHAAHPGSGLGTAECEDGRHEDVRGAMTEAREVGPVLLTEDLGPVRRLTLNRPASLNALNGDLMDALGGGVRRGG